MLAHLLTIHCPIRTKTIMPKQKGNKMPTKDELKKQGFTEADIKANPGLLGKQQSTTIIGPANIQSKVESTTMQDDLVDESADFEDDGMEDTPIDEPDPDDDADDIEDNDR